MKARWIYPFLIALVLGWLVSRPSGPGFVRLPGAMGMAPTWTMTNFAGQPIRSEAFAGKVVILNFWATWCPPCLRELPELKAFTRTHDTNAVVIIGAATDIEGVAKVKPFAARNGLDYPVLIAGLDAQGKFAPSGLPTTWVIGRDGRVVARYLGPLTTKELDRVVTPLLAVP